MTTSRACAAAASALLGLAHLAFQACGSTSTKNNVDGSGGEPAHTSERPTTTGPSAGESSNAGQSSNGKSNGNEGGAGDHTTDGDTSSDGGLQCADPTAWPCNTDPNCTSANAKSDATCTKDCKIGCGFDQLGTKLCSCLGGVYSQCPCPRPETYKGPETAKYCDDADFPSATETGLMEEMKGLPCETEWEQCIARDAPPGSTPRGCVCMLNLTTNHPEWHCGSTNKWFLPE